MNKSNKFSPEVHELAVRMVQEPRGVPVAVGGGATVQSITPKSAACRDAAELGVTFQDVVHPSVI